MVCFAELFFISQISLSLCTCSGANIYVCSLFAFLGAAHQMEHADAGNTSLLQVWFAWIRYYRYCIILFKISGHSEKKAT